MPFSFAIDYATLKSRTRGLRKCVRSACEVRVEWHRFVAGNFRAITKFGSSFSTLFILFLALFPPRSPSAFHSYVPISFGISGNARYTVKKHACIVNIRYPV